MCSQENDSPNNSVTRDDRDAFGYARKNNTQTNTSLPIAPTDRYATHYKMNHQRRGVAIVFNHELFSIGNLKPRSGTNIDCENLKNTLKILGFEVQVYHNYTSKDITNVLHDAANSDYSSDDCLIVSVLSHGELGMLYAYDCAYRADSIWTHFTSDKCPSLAGKPKMFFIQACQGDKLDPGVMLKERTETDHGSDGTFRIPSYADFLIAYSTIPGFYSWRNTTRGSWFMQALCAELKENGTRYDLLTLLTFVCQRVALDYESNTPDNVIMHQQKQIPCITSMLTRLVLFTKS